MNAQLKSTTALSQPPLSTQQNAVAEHTRKSKRSLNLIARAGCGKTFTVVYGIVAVIYHEQPGRQVAVMAFNKAAATEIAVRLEKAGMTDWRKVKAGTVHSFGLAAWNKSVPGIRDHINENKVRDLIDKHIPEDNDNTPNVWRDLSQQIKKLVSFGKNAGAGFLFPAGDRAKWYDIVEHQGLDDIDEEYTIDALVDCAITIFNESVALDRVEIDFDDMILAPLIHKARFWRYDDVVIDEAQDTNATRRALAKAMLKPGGRLFAVGDDRQAIYGFCHPAGTEVLTPTGLQNIETLKVGSSIIHANTSGETAGWKGSIRVEAVQKYKHIGDLIKIEAGKRSVEMTPHHKVPVRIDDTATYYTYMMRRLGCYRVGSCKAYHGGDFMLRLRYRHEKADALWILSSHTTKEAARSEERKFLLRVKGCSFGKMTNRKVRSMHTSEEEALKILKEHHRMIDFPLMDKRNCRQRISKTGAFITEACNLVDGMKIAFHDKAQANIRKGSKSGQRFNWTPISISRRKFYGSVYGITAPALKGNGQSHPLYFAGEGKILVHNTGANSDSLDIIKEEMNSETLPLNVTYRCPKAVVSLAQKLVPDFTAHPDAPEGVHRSIPYEIEVSRETKKTNVQFWWERENLSFGDAILCRNTKPLIEQAYALLRSGIGCIVEGREIGSGLMRLANKWRIKNLDALIPKLEEYKDRERTKWLGKGKEQKAQEVEDKVDTLVVLIEKVLNEGKHEISDLSNFITSLFGDSDDKNPPRVVRLATIHKSKGREWKRVYMLGRAKYLPSKWARKEWQLLQEENLEYVMITRAQEEAIDVVVKEAS